MILSCQNISKAFGTDVILKQASFHIEDHEKAAIVGINGAGKTTLLRIIVGEMEPDEGVVALSKGKTIGYLEQHQDVHSEQTIYEELLSVKEDVLRMEKKLREMEHEMKHLSGDALQRLMEQYNRISTEYEHQNGYALQSELTGVLKGLGFSEDEVRQKDLHAFRRPENACCTRPPAPLLTGSSSARRADQPSGSEFNRMAGKLSDEL